MAFALDCCDREAMSYVATTGGITGKDVRDLMVAAVEHRFGPVIRLPGPIEWLTDNGSCFVARETRRFARDIGLAPQDHTAGKPTIQRHGRGVRANPETRLRPRLTHPGCPERAAAVASLDGALQ